MLKRMVSFAAVAGLVLAMGTAAQAAIVLIDPTTNDGSFESHTGTTTWAPVTLTGSTVTGGSQAAVLDLNSHQPVWGSANMDGNDVLHIGDTTTPVTATFFDVLGTGGYTSVTAGDVFTWSFDITSQAAGAGATATVRIDFGNGPVFMGSAVSDASVSTTETASGTYTATAADASGGQVVFIGEILGAPGDSRTLGDNAQLSVDPIPDPASAVLLLLGLPFVMRRRRRSCLP